MMGGQIRKFATTSALLVSLATVNAAPKPAPAPVKAAAPMEQIIEVRADDCGVLPGDNPIRAISKARAVRGMCGQM